MSHGGPWKDTGTNPDAPWLTLTSPDHPGRSVTGATPSARATGWAAVGGVVAFVAGLLGGFLGALAWLAHPRW